jgi:hypothetical protein
VTSVELRQAIEIFAVKDLGSRKSGERLNGKLETRFVLGWLQKAVQIHSATNLKD